MASSNNRNLSAFDIELTIQKRNSIFSMLFCVPLVFIALFLRDMPYSNYMMWVLATPVVVVFGKQFFIIAFRKIRYFTVNMDTLVALSTGTAYVVSVFNTIYPSFWTNRGMDAYVYFEVSAIVVAFVLLGRYLEEKAKSNTMLAIKKLIGLQPRVARVVRNSEVIEIPIRDIEIGDEVIVRPGEHIPFDGKISKGSTFINESMISGEPLPVEKGEGKRVYAGTINEVNSFHFIVRKIGRDSLLGQVIKMIQEAQSDKRQVQKTVDKISKVFIPVIGIVAVITFFVWYTLAENDGFMHGAMSSVAVLIMACPCALGLATPTAIMAGIDKGAGKGILIKGSEALINAAELSSVVLDKTGTITEGISKVTHMQWIARETPELKGILYGIESYSEHPLAEAVKIYLRDEMRVKPDMKVSSLSGSGLMGETDFERYYVGTTKLLEEQDLMLTEEQKKRIERETDNSNTIVLFASQSSLLAIISIADKVKHTSLKAIDEMISSNLDLYMLTGDSKRSGDLIAKQVGIAMERVEAGASPVDKALFVKKLQANGEVVAMTGDGINDAGALAAADVSIAMGQGSDIAMEVAQVTIASSDLNKLLELIDLSKQAVRTIKQNLFWAFIFNIIGILVVAGIIFPFSGIQLSPVVAELVIVLSTTSVVINSFILRYKKKNAV